MEKHIRARIRCVQVQCGNTIAHAGPQNKNAPHDCEAFGAENETRTISCNTLKISDLEEAKKTSGETFVAFSGRKGEATSKDMERMCRVMKCHELPGRMMKGVPLDGGSSI